MSRNSSSRFRTRLTASLFFRFCATLFVFSIILVLLVSVVVFLSPFLVRFGLFYRLGSSIFHLGLNPTLVFAGFWITGFLVIIIVYFRISIGYVDKVVGAVDHLFIQDQDLVTLPKELQHVEEKINQVKYDMTRNQVVAREAEQRKNDLVVYLAHDLKTPLTSVIGYLTLLRDEEGISHELRSKYLSIAADKAQHLERLINQFFEVTRFNLYGLTLESSTLNLSMMLEQIADEFKPLLKPKNLTLSVSVEPGLIIQGDALKLERAFDNLIRNAVNYCYENTEIRITAVKADRGIEISLKNAGPAIAAHHLARIFEQFYRVDPARSKGGAGLGLAITKQIIDLHQGEISATSESDIIQFKIMLPWDVRKS